MASLFPTEFAKGGLVSWQKKLPTDKDGAVYVQHNLGGNSFYGWLVGTLDVAKPGCVLAQATGTVTVGVPSCR